MTNLVRCTNRNGKNHNGKLILTKMFGTFLHYMIKKEITWALLLQGESIVETANDFAVLPHQNIREVGETILAMKETFFTITKEHQLDNRN